MSPWGKSAKKKKARKIALESEVEKMDLKALLAVIDKLLKKVGKVSFGEKEFVPYAGEERDSAIADAKDVFSKLKDVEKIQEIKTEGIIALMKEIMDPETRADLEEELKIERKLKEQTLNLEILFDRMISHFKKTGDRRYIYNFLRVAGTKVEEEIREESKHAA